MFRYRKKWKQEYARANEAARRMAEYSYERGELLVALREICYLSNKNKHRGLSRKQREAAIYAKAREAIRLFGD